MQWIGLGTVASLPHWKRKSWKSTLPYITMQFSRPGGKQVPRPVGNGRGPDICHSVSSSVEHSKEYS